MECSSSLKLTIKKGPRAGETLEFTSKAVIKIGRFVRGNTIAIKDAGISTKHLSIQFDSAAANWTLLDLESSNGTILNSVDLVPLQPTVVKDGDTIKIGEYTSIVVGVEIGEIGASELRRNPRRGRKGGEVDKVGVDVGDSCKLVLGSGEDSEDSVVEVAPPVKRNMRGRPPKGGASLKNEGAEVRASTRMTRNSKKVEQVPESLNVDVSDSKEPEIFVGKGRGGRKGRRNLRDEEVDNGGMDENLGGEGCGGSTEMAAVGEGLLNVSLGGGGVDVREETRVTTELNSMKMAAVYRSLPNWSLEGVGVDGIEGKRVGNDVISEERGSKWLRKDDVLLEPDLAKMALGDWFDYLEAYLSKTIYDETEAMISSMKEQAAKLHEFRLQQEKMLDKGKRPIE